MHHSGTFIRHKYGDVFVQNSTFGGKILNQVHVWIVTVVVVLVWKLTVSLIVLSHKALAHITQRQSKYALIQCIHTVILLSHVFQIVVLSLILGLFLLEPQSLIVLEHLVTAHIPEQELGMEFAACLIHVFREQLHYSPASLLKFVPFLLHYLLIPHHFLRLIIFQNLSSSGSLHHIDFVPAEIQAYPE